MKQLLVEIYCMFLGFVVGFLFGSAWYDSQPETPKPLPTPAAIETASPRAAQGYTDGHIFRAICLWEHRGVIRPNDVSSAGAVGPAQIRQIFLDDSNEYAGTSYALEDCKDYEIAFEVTTNYWARYKLATAEQKARCHFGGPKGHLKACTLDYWKGVQKYL